LGEQRDHKRNKSNCKGIQLREETILNSLVCNAGQRTKADAAAVATGQAKVEQKKLTRNIVMGKNRGKAKALQAEKDALLCSPHKPKGRPLPPIVARTEATTTDIRGKRSPNRYVMPKRMEESSSDDDDDDEDDDDEEEAD
jgi:hypothetical protein